MKRKMPLRKCVGCNSQKPKKELIRVVKIKDGTIELDLTGKKNGRGAYVCPSESCLKKAYQNKALNRSLASNISEEIYREMEDVLKSE